MSAPTDTAPRPPAVTSVTARRIAWDRRRRALARFWREYRKDRDGMIGLVVLVLMIAVALAAPLLASSRGLNVTLATYPVNAGPGWHYPLGTDADGRSVLTELIWGSRISLLIGFAATLLSMVIGAVIGIVAGHFGTLNSWFGRQSDNVLMRVTDWFLVVPFLPLAIVLARTLGPSLHVIIIVIGITSWPGTARIIRAQALAVETRPYLERARALGAGHWHQMSKHVLPNVMPLLLANTILTVAGTILSETTLSFLGLGDPTRASWGEMLNNAFNNGVGTGNALWLITPGVAIIVVVMGFTLVGHAMEAVLNPRLRER
ncbi:MAG TPA: ABC transporter permease [Streptosporangiaceae bacterium]|nr:ABC transporter permease [Streptosporangiaceae bacterium]